MVKLNVYSAKGVRKGSTNLPSEFVEKINTTLLAQAVRVYEDRRHPGTSKVKTRGEVNASGAKIWRQKGTGRARHGDVKAPIFVGGGAAHGPKGIKRQLTLPKKMRQKAFKVALSLKAKERGIIVADKLTSIKKTNEAQLLLDTIIKKEFQGKAPPRITLALSKQNERVKIFFRNIKNCAYLPFENLNAQNVLFAGLLIVDKDALASKKPQAKVTRKPSPKTQKKKTIKARLSKTRTRRRIK